RPLRHDRRAADAGAAGAILALRLGAGAVRRDVAGAAGLVGPAGPDRAIEADPAALAGLARRAATAAVDVGLGAVLEPVRAARRRAVSAGVGRAAAGPCHAAAA